MSNASLEHSLAALAVAGDTITYGDLARALGLRMADLTAALERTMQADAAAGRPLRAALCRGKLSGDQPARGFFATAILLGLLPPQSDDAACRQFVLAQRASLRG